MVVSDNVETIEQIHSNYSEARRRLQNPPNPVLDIGIDLKREKPPRAAPVLIDPLQHVGFIDCALCGEWHERRMAPVPLRFGPRMADIIRVVAAGQRIDPLDIVGRYRRTDIVLARQMCCYLGRTICNPRRSFPEIGRLLGDRDHTSALHGYKKILRLRVSDGDVASAVARYEKELMAECRIDA